MRAKEFVKLQEMQRRGFLRGLVSFAAASAMPSSITTALATPQGVNNMSVSDAAAILKTIQAYLPKYDQQDYTGEFDRWERMAAALELPGNDEDLPMDQLDKLINQYRRNPEKAAQQLLKHLKDRALDSSGVRSQTIDKWDDIETVRKSQISPAEKKMDQKLAAYFASRKSQTDAAVKAFARAGAGMQSFKELIRKAISAKQATGQPAQSRVRNMGPVVYAQNTPGLPAPDKSAGDIIKDLQTQLNRPLTTVEKEVVKQEIRK